MAESNWRKATASRLRVIEEGLICHKCREANAPGRANLITLDARSFTATCAVCSHAWPVNDQGDPRLASFEPR
jgi:RNase P subunit RPR2